MHTFSDFSQLSTQATQYIRSLDMDTIAKDTATSPVFGQIYNHVQEIKAICREVYNPDNFAVFDSQVDVYDEDTNMNREYEILFKHFSQLQNICHTPEIQVYV